MIGRVLGLPDFKNWSYYKDLPEAHDKSLWLKDFTPLGLETAIPTLDDVGLDFVTVSTIKVC